MTQCNLIIITEILSLDVQMYTEQKEV